MIRIGKQFSLLKLEDIRYPKDKAAREQAEKEALQAKKTAVPEKRTRRGCRKKYVKIDQKLVDSLDFESAEPGFEKLRADDRVLATVKGEKPVTVGDLTTALEKKFFHGAERAAEEKKINRRKDQVLEEILNRRVTIMEAKKQKLERTEYFKVKAQENRNGVLFGAFVQKVIAPDVKVGEEELNGYYQAHIGEYTFPEMVRIDGLLFSDRKNGGRGDREVAQGGGFPVAPGERRRAGRSREGGKPAGVQGAVAGRHDVARRGPEGDFRGGAGGLSAVRRSRQRVLRAGSAGTDSLETACPLNR